MEDQARTLEYALGFAAGVAFLAPVMWVFIVLPMKKQCLDLRADAHAARDELKTRLIQDLEVYRRGTNKNA